MALRVNRAAVQCKVAIDRGVLEGRGAARGLRDRVDAAALIRRTVVADGAVDEPDAAPKDVDAATFGLRVLVVGNEAVRDVGCRASGVVDGDFIELEPRTPSVGELVERDLRIVHDEVGGSAPAHGNAAATILGDHAAGQMQ